jgi:hypothetical protein
MNPHYLQAESLLPGIDGTDSGFGADTTEQSAGHVAHAILTTPSTIADIGFTNLKLALTKSTTISKIDMGSNKSKKSHLLPLSLNSLEMQP